jgi:hypothetical protein
MEKAVVFQETTQTKEGYALLADKLTAFAELLSAQVPPLSIHTRVHTSVRTVRVRVDSHVPSSPALHSPARGDGVPGHSHRLYTTPPPSPEHPALRTQGCLHEAMGYLVQLPPATERDDPAALLMHRIHGAG